MLNYDFSPFHRSTIGFDRLLTLLDKHAGSEANGQTYRGYHIDPTRPVTVVLKLDYAVCDTICVPAKGEARLWLEPGVTSVTL